jgi:hypothetical protein
LEQKSKPKLDLNRVAMPHQKSEVRKGNFDEVALGYSNTSALQEANR